MSDEIPLRGAGYRASVDLNGAALRALSFDGTDLVPHWPDDLAAPMYAGVTCAPWPNRVGAARYRYEGTEHQLIPTPDEPGNALHGLVSAVGWRIAAAATDRVRLTTQIDGAPGWPFSMGLTMEYQVGPYGLGARAVATNTGATRLPYGYCPHPYLVAPVEGDDPGRVDHWSLRVPGASVLGTDAGKIPISEIDVTGSELDFRDPRVLGGATLDHCFGALQRGGDSLARVRVWSGTQDRATEMSWGPWAPWVQVYSGDRPGSAVDRRAVAVEPMSCPPDAYNSTIDLVELEPGEQHEAEWSIALVEL